MRGPLLHAGLDRAAREAPDKIAVCDGDQVLTYQALADRSRRIAAWLQSVGVGPGERVALHLSSGPDTAACLFAISRTGAAFIPIDPRVSRHNLRHILADAEPVLLIADGDAHYPQDVLGQLPVAGYRELFGEAAALAPSASTENAAPEDPAALIYTSGSTGKPKAIVCPHRNMVFATQAIQARLRLRPEDRIANLLPLSFDYGLYQIFLAAEAAATVVFGQRADAGPTLLGRLSAWGATVLPAVPAIVTNLVRLLRRGGGASDVPLRMITNTGAHLPVGLIEQLRDLLPQCAVYPMFGLSECKRVSILTPEEYLRKPRSVGRPLPGTRVYAVDPEGRPVAPGEKGELVVVGPHVMDGYWRSPENDRLRFRFWVQRGCRALFSGDMGSVDGDGYVYFYGRNDDLYKQQGYRVSALEVEQAALATAGVEEATLVLPRRDQPAILYFVGAVSEAAVREALRLRLEDYKVPPRLVRLEAMPYGSNGKIDKAALSAA